MVAVGGVPVAARADDDRSLVLFGPRPTVWGAADPHAGGAPAARYASTVGIARLRAGKRGFMNRFLGGFTKSVRKPWHIYPIAVLFGLGFDTATEIDLLVLAGGAAAFNLPFYAILVLPILFATGCV